MRWKDIGRVAKSAWAGLMEKDLLTQAAALAFYTALGLAPMILLTLSITAGLGKSTQIALLDQIASLLGDTAAESIDLVIQNAKNNQDASWLSFLIALGSMSFSVAGIFAQLQSALNRIWGVEAKPSAAWLHWLRTRLLSMGMFLSILFLLLVSLVISTGIGLLVQSEGWGWMILNGGLSMAVYVGLFALIFKFLPDVVMGWRDVWVGAVLTAMLFAIGKEALGFYLSQAGTASSYGAAGSLIALLVWVYYSALIVLLGAELTRAYANHAGQAAQPDLHAEPTV